MKALLLILSLPLFTLSAWSAEASWSGLAFGSPRSAIEQRFPGATWIADQSRYSLSPYELKSGTALDKLSWKLSLACDAAGLFSTATVSHDSTTDSLKDEADDFRAHLSLLYGPPIFDNLGEETRKTMWRRGDTAITLYWGHYARFNDAMIYVAYQAAPSDSEQR